MPLVTSYCLWGVAMGIPAPGDRLVGQAQLFERVIRGAAEIQGTARASDGSIFGFDADMRFMRGAYMGTDGRFRQGAFGFI